jgi:transposase
LDGCPNLKPPTDFAEEAYLKRWGFTTQRPLKKAYEQPPEAIAKWVNEEYPKIAAQAKEEGAEIQWGDETGLRSDDVRGRGYAPKGKTPVVLANANRSKLSVISTVTNKGQMRWKVFSGALNAKVLTGFMKRLVYGREKRIFLVLDNLRVHHSKAVKKWLKENEDKILVFYLPSYSPELNPDELLNADLKQHVTKAAPARNKIALTRTAIGALHPEAAWKGRTLLRTKRCRLRCIGHTLQGRINSSYKCYLFTVP